MPFPIRPGGLAQGTLDYRQQTTNQDYTRAIMASILLANERARQQAQARAAMGPVFDRYAGMEVPPPPGSVRGPMPPQVGQPSMPMQPQAGPIGPPPSAGPMPGPAPAAAPQPAPIPPYRALPQPAPEDGEEGGGIAPPPVMGGPAPAAAPAARGGLPAPVSRETAQPHYNMPNFIKAMKAEGVRPELMMDMLDAAKPHLDSQNQMEVKLFQIENQALKLARDYALREVEALRKQRETEIKEREQKSKDEARKARNEINEKKLQQQAGGAGNIVRWETDDDGNVVGGYTRGGQHIKLSDPGTARTPGAGARRNELRDVNAARAELATLELVLKPSVADLARKEEIKRFLRERGGGTAPKPDTDGAGAVTPMPKSKAELVSGTVYQTARGAARWNGTAFELVQ